MLNHDARTQEVRTIAINHNALPRCAQEHAVRILSIASLTIIILFLALLWRARQWRQEAWEKQPEEVLFHQGQRSH